MSLSEFLQEPAFWIFSTLGSLLLSILANLLTPYINSFLSKLSRSQKTKTEKKRLNFLNEVVSVSTNSNNILNYKMDAIFNLLKSIFIIAGIILLLSITSIFSSQSIFFKFFTIISYIVILSAIIISNTLLIEAIKKYKIARLASERAKVVTNFEREFYHMDYTPKNEYPDIFNEDLNAELKKWDTQNIM